MKGWQWESSLKYLKVIRETQELQCERKNSVMKEEESEGKEGKLSEMNCGTSERYEVLYRNTEC